MKTFFGRVLAVLTGIFIFTVLSLIIFGSVSSSLEKNNVTLNDNSILVISLDKEPQESPFEQIPFSFNLTDKSDVYFDEILNQIANAANDDLVKGIFLDLDSPSDISISKTNEIRNSLEEFKKSKKFIYAYTNKTEQNGYYLASIADSIFHHPMGTIEWKGLGSEVYFYKTLADKYGIDFDIIRHGKYKSAVEPFIRNDLSDENKFQLRTILNGFWNQIISKISQKRNIETSSLNDAANNLIGFDARELLKAKFIDVIAQKEDVYDFLKNKIGIDKEDDSFFEDNLIDWIDYASISKKTSKNNDKIAILYAGGNIMPGDGRFGIQSKTYIDAIKNLENADDVKAVVLRINSGGGDAVTSDEILYQLKRLNQKKPIVISLGDVAASGGYYIAQIGEKIFAEDFSITGSIGVFGMIPNGKRLANSIGVTTDTVSTNANTIYLSPLRGLTPLAKERLENSIESTYQRFISLVAKSRKMPISNIDSLGGGRVYTARQALKYKLIDEIGGINKAINYAKKMANLKNGYEITYYPEPLIDFEILMKELDISSEIANKIIGTENSELLKEYSQLKELKKAKGIQMWWPYNFKIK